MPQIGAVYFNTVYGRLPAGVLFHVEQLAIADAYHLS